MLKSGLYTLSSSTLALVMENGRYVAYTVPEHETLTIAEGTFCGDRLVEVLWAGRTVLMFAEDLLRYLQRCQTQESQTSPEKLPIVQGH